MNYFPHLEEFWIPYLECEHKGDTHYGWTIRSQFQPLDIIQMAIKESVINFVRFDLDFKSQTNLRCTSYISNMVRFNFHQMKFMCLQKLSISFI